MFDDKCDKVIKYLQGHPLISVINDFSNMPDDISGPLFSKFPDYPPLHLFLENIKKSEFNSFNEFMQAVFNYLRTIPDTFPDDENLTRNAVAFSSCLKEIMLSLHRYANLLQLDKNVLKARYTKHISNKFTNLLNERPDTFFSEMLYESDDFMKFGSHSIPSKINPP